MTPSQQYRFLGAHRMLRLAWPWVGPLGLAAAYFIAARVCVYISDTGKSPAALWIPSGLALAATVRFGPRWSIGVFLGSLVANLVVELTWPAAILLAFGNALDAFIGGWAIRRVAGNRLDFGRTRHVFAFMIYGVVIGPALSGALGMASMQLGGVYSTLPEFVSGWIGWALEDAISVLIISSALLMIPRMLRRYTRQRVRLIESVGLLALLTVNGWLVLTGTHGDPLSEPYLVVPLMLFIVLRLGSGGAIVGNLLLTILAAWAVVNREGPFMLDTLSASMLWMQSFWAVAGLTTMLLAAALNEARSERYRQMFDGNQTIQLVVDRKTGRIVDANPAARAFYGDPDLTARQLSLDDLSSSRDVEVYRNDIQVDGRQLIYAIVHDVSARRRAEEALRHSEERFQLVARATNDTVWDWEIQSNNLWHNQGATNRFEDVRGTGQQWLSANIHPDDRERVMSVIHSAADRGDDTWAQEYSFRRADGSYAHGLARGYISYQGATPARMVGVLLDLTERKRMEEALAYRATHDMLTGLPNRALVESTLQNAVECARRDGTPFGLLIADLDRFKEVNDSLGHHVGDTVLQLVAERWRWVLREDDLLGRLAGDEFAVILPAIDSEAAEAVAQRLAAALESPLSVDGNQLSVGASLGLSTFPTDALDAESLLRCADRAMYVSKRAGGGFVRNTPNGADFSDFSDLADLADLADREDAA